MKDVFPLLMLFVLCAFTAHAQTGAAAGSAMQSQTSTAVAGRDARAVQAGSAAVAGTAGQSGAGGSVQQSTEAVNKMGGASAGAAQASSVSAELTQKINSKNAKAGDEVVARTTSAARMSDGSKLPKGTRLLGMVTEVQAKNGAQHDGHLAFVFDRAETHDGRQIPVHAVLQSISAPVAAGAMGSAGASDDLFAGGGGAMAGGRAVGSGRGGGGGLLGGGAGTLGGGAAAVSQAGGMVSGGTSGAVGTPAGVEGVTANTVHSAGGVVGQTTGGQIKGLGTQTTGLGAVVVSNLPGITASGSASGGSALDARGKNVELSGGTQLVFSVAMQ
jgi:hypothetical protein